MTGASRDAQKPGEEEADKPRQTPRIEYAVGAIMINSTAIVEGIWGYHSQSVETLSVKLHPDQVLRRKGERF